LNYGATPLAQQGVQFRAWAPNLTSLAVKLEGPSASVFPMTRDGDDFEVLVPDAHAGDLYSLVLNDKNHRPDPVSRSQPQGVHGPSQIVDPRAFVWSDHTWAGIPLRDYIFYELHTGTFTPEGTFEGVISRIRALKELGITAIELMPLAEFTRNSN
jgi:maltooligosyltrehalose trehalohydrolase